MNIYFLSDIHGNLPALETALKNIESEAKKIFLGDIVNYGPWSNECVELIDTLDNKITIMGNHEKYFLENFKFNNSVVEKFFNKTYSNFRNINIIKNYINDYVFDKFYCTHTIENKKIFIDTKVNLNSDCIIGHTHQQYINNKNLYKIINPGSIGQNRFDIKLVSYCRFNTKNKTFQFFNIEYDYNLIINKMRSLNYPSECLEYYLKKI